MRSYFFYLIAFTFTLFLLLPQHSNAQVYGGTQAGLNLSNVMGGSDPFPNPDFRLGLNGGVLLGYEFSDKWALETDMGFVMKGAKQDYLMPINDTIQVRVNSDLQLMYGQGDLILKFSPPIDRKGVIPYGPFTRRVFLDIFVGGYFGYFLSGSHSASYSTFINDSLIAGSAFDSTLSFSSSDSIGITPIDFGAVIGLGVKIKVGKQEKGRIFANFRYALGLNSLDGGIYSTYGSDSDGNLIRIKSDLTNHSIIFMVGYSYSFEGGPKRVQ